MCFASGDYPITNINQIKQKNNLDESFGHVLDILLNNRGLFIGITVYKIRTKRNKTNNVSIESLGTPVLTE